MAYARRRTTSRRSPVARRGSRLGSYKRAGVRSRSRAAPRARSRSKRSSGVQTVKLVIEHAAPLTQDLGDPGLVSHAAKKARF